MTFPYIDVLLFGNAANPLGEPSDWIAQSQGITQAQFDSNAPPTWPLALRMTMSDFDAYYIQHKPAHDAWLVTYQATLDAAAATAAQAARDAASPECATLRDQANAALNFNDSATTANNAYLPGADTAGATAVRTQVKTLTQQINNVLAENTKIINALKVLARDKLNG